MLAAATLIPSKTWADEHFGLSAHGTHRVRYQVALARRAGPAAVERDEATLTSRNLLRVEAQSLYVTGLVELGSHLAKVTPGPASAADTDALDVHQGYAQVGTAAGGARLALRLGRQEMPLGSTRWVSVRDGANVRRTFDQAKLTFSGVSWSSESFGGWLSRRRAGVFDDLPVMNDAFWGTYWTVSLEPEPASLELFVFGRRRDHVSYVDAEGSEMRHTFGARWFHRRSDELEYAVHALAQAGSIGGKRIRAWGLAAALWQALGGGVKIGLRTEALSGDGVGDDALGTFDPLFPNLSFFGALAAIHPTNLYDLHPLLRLQRERLQVEVGCAVLWRQTVADAVYTPAGARLADPSSAGKFTGYSWTLAFAVETSKQLWVATEASYLDAGAALRAGGLLGTTYFASTVTLHY